jgi:hypothetical protein
MDRSEMKYSHLPRFLNALIASTLVAGSAQAQPTYSADIPESVTTPDIVRAGVRAYDINVRFWHLADILCTRPHVRFRG